MPIDLAIPHYLSKEEFGYRKTPMNPCIRFKPSHRFEHKDGGSTIPHNVKEKKRVSFADHKGFALTKVKMFSQLNDSISIPLNIQEMLKTTLLINVETDKLVLDFSQPSANYMMFRQRLESNLVSLEHCILKEHSFSGTIKVKNVSFEKSVKLRVTFDVWKSFKDVDCLYVNDTYPDATNDTFSFEVTLPDQIQAHEHIEFAICYEVNGSVYWDSNQGKNYRVVWSAMRSSWDICSQGRHASDFGIHFDRYGSPTCSHGIYPDWPSYAAYDNIGPYY